MGTFERKLDSSNRFRLPKEILRELKPDKVKRLPCISISGECLVVCHPKPFREIVESFSSAKISNPQHRQLARDLFANTENCRVDTAGRMMLTARSRKCAGILSELVLVGTGRHFEIWSKERFSAQCRDEAGKSLMDRLRRSGLTI